MDAHSSRNSEWNFDIFIKKIVVVWSFTADSNLLQPTGCVSRTPHTSYFLVQLHAHAWLMSCMRSCVCSDSLRLLHFPLFALHLLSYHPVLPPAHPRHLPRCGGQIPCALSLMRTLAPLPSTTLSHGLNHGPVWKIQSFLLSEICTVILWPDCCGKGNLRKSYWSTVGRRFPIENAFSFTLKRGDSYLCMWMTSNWLEKTRH